MRVHFLLRPEQAHGILRHLQRGDRHAAGIGRLCRAEQHARFLEQLHRLRRGGHIGALGHGKAAVFDQRPRTGGVQLVLRRAGQRDLAGDLPDVPAAGTVDRARTLRDVFGNAAALDLLEPLHQRNVDARRVVHVAAGVGHCHDLCAELLRLFAGIKCNISGARNHNGAPVEALSGTFQHFLREVAQAVARRLCSLQAAAVAQPLARQCAVEFVVQALVLAEEVADLAAAHADVPGRHIGVRADVLVQLDHKALAETHDLRVGFPLGVEIAAALCAADGQARQAVFEDLLEAEEFDDALIDRGVEAQTALIRADGIVELHAEAAVDVDMSAVVRPRHAEFDHAIRFDQALQHARFQINRVRFNDRLQRGEHLPHRLMEFRFPGIPLLHPFDQFPQCLIVHFISS